MKPKDIQNLIRSAKNIRQSENNPIPYLLIAYAAWEALRFRFLRVLINRHGWYIKDANEVLRKAKISNMQSAQKIIERLGKPSPNRWSGLSGKIWRQLVKIEYVRNRLSHGYDSLNPFLILACGDFLVDILENRRWLEEFRFKDEMIKEKQIGPLFEIQLKHKIKNSRTVNELFDVFSMNPNDHSLSQKAKLPSISDINLIRNSILDHTLKIS